MADKEEGIAIDPDWWTSGWNAFLPRQGLFLHMVVATATQRETDGDFTALVDDLGADIFNRDTGGLSGPIWWSFPDEEDPDPEQIAMDAASQHEFETTMARAGRPLPATVLELVDLMVDLGIFVRSNEDGVERWRSPQPLPLTAEALPVSPEFAARQDEHRWEELHEASAQTLIRHAIDALDCPERIDTTLTRLAVDVGLDVADVRFGLANLSGSGFSLVDKATDTPQDPETVEEVRPITVSIDWERFNEQRFSIQFDPPEGEDAG
jgi:hypothetical protein